MKMMKEAPTYHVLNLKARWSVDATLNDNQLLCCFPFEETVPILQESHLARSDKPMREFLSDPHNLAFNQGIIVADVRSALWSSPHHGEEFVHTHPFEFHDLAFVRYDLVRGAVAHAPLRFSHRVLT
jgi:hypothetical protein